MGDGKTQTIMIVEDHGAVGALLHHWLRIGLPECRFVQAGSGEQTLALLAVENPNLVLIDTDARSIDGMETTRQIKAAQPQVKVVILSNHEEREYRMAAAKGRASGYVTKAAMWEHLVPLLKKLLDERAHRRWWALTRSAPAWLPGEIQPELDLPDSEE